jgi:WD40 repeat protein
MFRQFIIVVFILLCTVVVAQQKPQLVLQTGHTDQINSINFSPDEKHVVSAGRGGDVRVWETYSGRLMYKLELPQGLMVLDARYHANGREVLITCFQRYTDAHLYIWHPETGNKGLMPLSSTTMASEIKICNGDSLALVRYPDGSTELVEMPVGVKLLQMFPQQGHTINISAAAVSQQQVFAPKYTDTVYVFDRATKKPVKTLAGLKVQTASYTDNGDAVLVITPTALKKYDTKTWKIITEIKLPVIEEGNCSISPQGNAALYFNSDIAYKIELNSATPPKELVDARAAKHNSRIVGVSYSPDGKTYAINYETGFNLIKRTTTTDSLYYYEGLTYSPTGNYFLAKNSQNIYLFKTSTKKKLKIYTSGVYALYGKGLSADGYGYFNTLSGTVFRMDINRQRVENTFLLPAETSPLFGFDINTNSELLAYWQTRATKDLGFDETANNLIVKHLPTGKTVGNIAGYGGRGELMFSPDGEKLLIRTKSTITLVNCLTGNELSTIQTGNKTDIYKKPAVFTGNNQLVAILQEKGFKQEGFDDGEGGTQYLADTVEMGNEGDDYYTDGNDENDITFSKYFATVINLETGKIQNNINLGDYLVSDFGIAHNGDYIYSLYNSKVKIWDVKTGQFLYDVKQEGQYPAVIAPLQNNMLATAFAGKTIKVWQMEGKKPKAITSTTPAKAKIILPLSGDRFITTHADYSFTLWQCGEKLTKLYTVDLKGDCQNIWANEKQNEIIAITRDYYIDKYRLDNGQFIGSFVITGDGSLVAFDTEGNYKATASTAQYMGWQLDRQLYDFDQWDAQYNRPDKVLKTMGCADKELIEAYENARKKRLRRMGVTEKQLQANNLLPQLQVHNKTELEGEKSSSSVVLDVTATDGEAKNYITKIIVSVNGNPIHGLAGMDVSGEKSSNKNLKIPVQLNSGINAIKISCINNLGAESLREAVYVSYEPSVTPIAKTWFIGIGVSQYADAKHNLTYAKKDAGDMAAAFGKNKNTQTIIITDKEATKENILAVKSRLLKETTVNDAVIVSLSGHGIIDDEYNFYFATHDVDFKKPAAKGLGYNDILWLLDSLPVRNKLVLMDACHSGELDKEEIAGIKELNEHPTDTNVRATRSGIELLVDENENKGLGLGSTFELMQELFANIGRGNGATIISAAAGTEFAFEGNKWKNGVFTYCVLKGLTEKLADANSDGEITVTELQNYVSVQVQQLTNGRQRPVGRQTNFDNDWVVWE